MNRQASYAAGNSFSDTIVQYCVGLGERATVLNLGVFAITGAADEKHHHARVPDWA